MTDGSIGEKSLSAGLGNGRSQSTRESTGLGRPRALISSEILARHADEALKGQTDNGRGASDL